MNFFSTLRYALAITTVVCGYGSWGYAATPNQVQQMLQTNPRISSIDKKQKHYDTVSLIIFTWKLDQNTYRMVYNPSGLATVTVRKKGQVAFSEIFRKNIQHLPVSKLQQHIIPKPETIAQSNLYNDSDIDPEAQKKQTLLSEDFSTSDVLSWNRLLNDVYKGNPVSSSGSSNAGESAGEGGEDSLGQATSMAKMMNQCGGQSKSNAAQKQALQNIAQALVAAAANSDSIARASEGYTENTRDFEKNSQDSTLQEVQALTDVNLRQLIKSIQQAKRDIQKVLRSDFQQVVTMQEGPLDHQSLSALRRLREKHSAQQLQTLFSESSRNLVMSKTYTSYFTQTNPPYVIWTKNRRSFVINPFLQSQSAYRHALVQALILWEERF